MTTVERDRPRAHLVVDDFFTPAALKTIFAELPSLQRQMKPGLVRDIGHDGQSVFFEHRRRRNRAVWIHDRSKTLRLFREQLWSDPMLGLFEDAREPLFQIIPRCWAPNLQVSSYMTGDHYDFHEDEGAGVNLTSIVFLAARPERVHGGDLVLAYGGEQKTIRFRHNRLVIFPSRTLHRVTRVRVESSDASDARVSLQCWLAYGQPPRGHTGRTGRTGRPRRAEVDRPTFLLAEESIIAAAQALLRFGDQGPEDLYWGAFYVSRILVQNLRCVAAALGTLTLGPIRIRHRDALEVFGRSRGADRPVRVGFRIEGPPTAPAAALSLFVETGRGRTQSRGHQPIPPGADEQETLELLRALLTAQR